MTAPPASPPSGPEIDDPIGRANHVEVVLDHEQECPRSISWLKARSSFAMSSKCRPVVGSSNRNSVRCVLGTAVAARWPASFRRCASPPDERGHRLAESQIVEAHFARAAPARAALRVRRRRIRSASETVRSSTSAMRFRPLQSATSEHLRAIPAAVAIGAAQVHIDEELHFDVLEAVAAAGRDSGRCRN